MIDLERITNSFGILDPIRRFGANAMGIVQNRLELIAIEFKEEKTRLISMAVWTGALIFLAFLGIVSLVCTLVFAFWEQRVAIMGGFCAVFLLGAFTSFLMLKNKVRKPPFAETISQFKKDREWLQGK